MQVKIAIEHSGSDSVYAGSGIVHDLAPLFLGQHAERLLNELLRLGPDGSSVWIIRGPHGVVRRIALYSIQKDRLVDERRIHLPLDVLTRFEAQLL